MNNKQNYTVAGHTFCLVMPQSEPVWQSMQPAYDVFKECTDKQPLFTLSVHEEIATATITPIFIDPNQQPEEVKLDVYNTLDGYLFVMRAPFTDQPGLRLQLDRTFTAGTITLQGDAFERLYALNNALILSFLLATARLDTVVMHASAVVNSGKAYLFLGRSGTGKSTHSLLWQQAIEGTLLLNDDHPILRVDPQGGVIAYGSPWSGKTPCYRNQSAPVGGIVRIKRALTNKIHRLSPIQSYASLLTSSSGMTWEKELADSKDRTLQQIIAAVPCWTLECLPDEAAAQVCAQAVRKEDEACPG